MRKNVILKFSAGITAFLLILSLLVYLEFEVIIPVGSDVSVTADM